MYTAVVRSFIDYLCHGVVIIMTSAERWDTIQMTDQIEARTTYKCKYYNLYKYKCFPSRIYIHIHTYIYISRYILLYRYVRTNVQRPVCARVKNELKLARFVVQNEFNWGTILVQTWHFTVM